MTDLKDTIEYLRQRLSEHEKKINELNFKYIETKHILEFFEGRMEDRNRDLNDNCEDD